MQKLSELYIGVVAGAAALAFASPAVAAVLTFDGEACGVGKPCGTYNTIDQGYGDTANLDVQYRFDSTGSASEANTLRWWAASYNDLVGVAYGTPSISGASIFFAPTAGYSVTLNAFNLGAWPNRTGAPSQFSIFDGLGNTLFSSGSILIGEPGNIASLFTPNLTSASGIGVKWGPDSYNVGIDNVTYSVNPLTAGAVPEPSTWAMMLAGLGLLGASMRRKQTERVRFAF